MQNENLADGITLFLFKDRLVLKAKIEEKEIVRQDYTYSDFIAGYTGEKVIKEIKIQKDVVDPDDVEMLEDLILTY